MQYDVEIGGRTRQVTIHRHGDLLRVAVDGHVWTVDAARVDAHTWSLIVAAGPASDPAGGGRADGASGPGPDGGSGVRRAYEAIVVQDAITSSLLVGVGPTTVPVVLDGRRRRGRHDEAGAVGSGPERLVAPMPGKIVRVLVKTGEAVLARQPLVVIEAMKMENELRARRDGTVVEVHGREGASVDAGALLVVMQ